MSETQSGQAFRTLLRGELLRRCRANPHYSMRAFARALDYDVASLSKILSGKRAAGPRVMTRMGEKLRLKEAAIRELIYDSKLQGADPYRAAAPDEQFQNLTEDTFKFISDWYHYAILELIYVKDFRPRTAWISKTLGLPASEVELAVRRLKRLGLLTVDAKGKWSEANGDRLTTTKAEFTDGAFRNMQRQLLMKAAETMERVPIEQRDQSSMTMAIDTRKIKTAKAKIKTFRREMSAYLARDGEPDAVYALTISLFPLMQLKRNPK